MSVKNALVLVLLACFTCIAGEGLVSARGMGLSVEPQGQSAPGQPAIAKRLGTIKAINGNAITLAPDSGPEVAVTVAPNARLLRLGPGEKDLKNTTPMQLQELQVGDTIRVRGTASDDGKTIVALEVLLITRTAVAAVTDQIRQDWQKRGVGGTVRAVDAATGMITISGGGLGTTKTIAVHTAKNTVVRRYAPDSVKFEDAKPSTLQEIHIGDQLRARGERSADGSEVTADEIVSGMFPYVEGTVKSVDASAGTLSVQDVLTKKTVLVKVTAESQLHKIPAEMAQRFAMRLKGTMPPGMPGAAGGASAGAKTAPGGNGPPAQGGASTGGMAANGTAPNGAPGGAGGSGGARSGGGFDFQQLLSRLPASTLEDLHLQKGDAVVILATEGSPSSASTAITLLSGVEPILQATPSAAQALMLAPWSLGGAPGGDQ
jgi:hypothetical protein